MSETKTRPAWIEHIEVLVNKALALDEETLLALGELKGKVIAFEFSNTRLKLFLFPSDQGLTIKTEFEEKANVLLRGTPMNFISMLAASKESTATLPAEMELIGDIGLAQRFQHIMQNMEVDLEEPLSRIVGDTMAYQMGQFFRNTRQFFKQTSATLANDMSEYLRFETEMLPDDLLVREYCEDVDKLRDDVDRLDQRISKLQASLKEKAS